MQGRLSQSSKMSVRSVFRSELLWKIYGTIAVSILAALLMAALVFLYRYPLLQVGDVYDMIISLVIAMFAGATLALAVGFWLARGIKRSLSELIRVAQNLTSGDFSSRVKKMSDDEFGLLGLTLNLLGEEIAERMATLSQERTQLAALFGGMVEGIVAIGDDDRVLFANGAADRLLKTQASLSRSKQINDVPGLGIILPLVIQCRTEKKRKLLELTLVDGESVVTLETQASPFKGEQNAGVVVVLHDVTELRRLERIRRDFVANVSHELKTPLTSIKGYLETLQNGAKNDPEILNRFLNRIDVNVGRLVELVQEILSLARVEAQGGTLRRMAVDLANVARESLVQHEHAVTEKNIDLQVQMDESIVVHGDREAVRQVIDNLLGNAIKYTPDGGGVTFGIKKEQNYAVLTVTDTGVGIPSEHHGRIFERFYRVDKHRNREDGGTGLGLSIVKHLVHSMHGKISVDSTVGRGSTFQVQMHLHR